MDNVAPDIARKLLSRDFANLVSRVQKGGKLTRAERAMLQSMATGTGPAPATASSYVELAAVLGVTRQSVAAWKKRKDAPKPAANGPHDVAAWNEFMRRNDLKGGDSPGAAPTQGLVIFAVASLVKDAANHFGTSSTTASATAASGSDPLPVCCLNNPRGKQCLRVSGFIRTPSGMWANSCAHSKSKSSSASTASGGRPRHPATPALALRHQHIRAGGTTQASSQGMDPGRRTRHRLVQPTKGGCPARGWMTSTNARPGSRPNFPRRRATPRLRPLMSPQPRRPYPRSKTKKPSLRRRILLTVRAWGAKPKADTCYAATGQFRTPPTTAGGLAAFGFIRSGVL